MKILKKILLTIFIILAVASILAVVTGHSHLFKAISTTYLVGKTGPGIDDYVYFENREVEAGDYEPWKISDKYNQYKNEKLHHEIEKYKPAALVVIKDEELVYEEYWDKYNENSKTNSFSMAKSFVSLMIGIAIQEGKINSVNDPVADYLTEYKEHPELTIKHLLTMSSGINFDESYKSPFGHMAKAYYGTDIKKLNENYTVTEEPGKKWKYLGGNTIILGFIIEKVTGMNLSEYFSSRIWQKVGAKNNALWTIDKQGRERSYCCFYSNAKDFARVGQMVLNCGTWDGKRVISEEYLEKAIAPAYYLKDKNGKPVDFYGYQIWNTYYKNLDVTFFRGIQGQYIIIIPEKNMVIVRLGHQRSPKFVNGNPSDLYTYIDFGLGM